MDTKYGYKAEDWEAAKEEMRQIHVECARLEGDDRSRTRTSFLGSKRFVWNRISSPWLTC